MKINKFGVVLIVLSFIMIIMGGFIIMRDINFDNNKKDEKIEQVDNKEEVIENGKQDESEKTLVQLAKAPSNNSEYKTFNDGEYLTDKGYTLKIENGIASVDGTLIVNKTYSLPSGYGVELTSDVMKAFNEMKAEATLLGLNLWIQSGYRSFSRQEAIYNNYVILDGVDLADTYSARPGHSEHQSGLSFDLNTIDDSFTYTDEGKWVSNNCYRFGFILRYPKGKDSITGYIHESWHLRYVGIELASKLYNNGDWITLEEYFGISSSY